MAKRDRHEIELLNYWRSSCSWRVRMVLEHKQLSYKYTPVNLLKGEDETPAYWNMNPSGVPTLKDGDTTVVQSLAIMEYLEEKYPDQPVLPRGFHARSEVRAIALFIASGIQPLQNLAIAKKIEGKFGADAKMPWLVDVITEGLTGLEAMLKRTAGKCCFGDEFSMADCCIVPQAYAARRFGVSLDQFPTITRVLAHVEALDVVKNTHPDKMPDAVVAK